ncbi:gp488 [Bacillus phage G]|uniref:Gp488 n=1 Tax=Bacillus phage G TaxID=2884420 RepID=G3MAM9_9CAUD|nr:gp488 [Bacillus phage G]AEO93746.1 gp488 [Bacillus phage G]
MIDGMEEGYEEDLKEYKEVFDVLDSYVLSCELRDIKMYYSITQERYSSLRYNIRVVTTELWDSDKTDNFNVKILNAANPNNKNMKFCVEIDKDIDGVEFNTREMANRLKKLDIYWDKTINKKRKSGYHGYVVWVSVDKFRDVFDVFTEYLI